MSGARRALAVVGWGLALGALLVVWRDPELVQRLRLARRTAGTAAGECVPEGGQACTSRFADGVEVRLSTSSPVLRPGKDVVWTIATNRADARVTAIELTGVTMPMGLTTLSTAPAGEGAWAATGALPVCTVSAMEWRADVLLEADGRSRVASFTFTTGHDAPLAAGPGRGAAALGAPPPTWGDFTVSTADGPLALADLRGNVVLLYFGYTACPDVCPTTLATLSAAVARLDPAQQARVVGLMVSLDPARDELSRLRDYARHFDPRFRAGTTDDASLDRITADWGVGWRVTPLPGSALGYAIDHATWSTLVGADGRVLGTIEHGAAPEDVAARITEALAPAPGQADGPPGAGRD